MHTHMKLTMAGAVIFTLSLMAATCGGSYSPTTPTPPGGGTTADLTITMLAMNGPQSYTPNPGTVRVGQKVAWRNADSVAHTATADAGAFDTGNVAPGATSSAITMTSAGTFSYHCTLHGFTMTGTVTVTQ
jgi:plastocyanin